MHSSEIHILLRKEGLPLATTRNHNISEIQTKKGLKLCIFGSQNTIFLSGKGHFPLANPARGPAPWTLWTPRTSAQSARFAGSWAPHVEILPKHMDSIPPIIHFTHYTMAISQYVHYVHVCKKNIKMIIFRICPYDWFVNITWHQWLEMTSSNKTSLVLSFSPTSLLKTLTGGGSKKFRVRWKGGSKKLRVSWKGGSKKFRV